MRKLVALSMLATLSTLTGCGDSDSPEAQVRAVIENIELAAEARDVGELMDHVSPQFRDNSGREAQELSQYVRGYFVANQAIHLLTRIGPIEFPTQDEARAKVSVGMVGREAAESNAWNLAAEIYDFDVTFRHEEDEWKVTHAKWERPLER